MKGVENAVLKVVEVAELLGVSRGTIYKKIKKLSPKLDNHVFKQHNTTYIDNTGIDILKNNISVQDDTKVYTREHETIEKSVVSSETDRLKDELIEDLKRQVKRLEEEVDLKNQQFSNFQVLLKQEQDRSLLLEHQLDEKAETEMHKSIWERLFGSRR